MATYRIPESNLEVLKERVAKLQRRAAKLNCGEISFSIGQFEDIPLYLSLEGYTETPNNRPSGQFRRYYSVEVSGQAPRINGWTLAGTIEHIGEAGNVLRMVPDTPAVPVEYRNASPACDHCRLDRNRRDTFLVISEAGEWKQVGRQCLADFLGHVSPEALAEYAELLAQCAGLCEDADEFDGGHYCEPRYGLLEVLEWTAASIRNDGWVSRRESEIKLCSATADRVLNLITNAQARRLEVTEEDENLAAQSLAWSEGLGERSDLNDYLHNLSVLAKSGAINRKGFGLACSMVSAYMRELEMEIKQAKQAEDAAKSNFVGTVGERTTFELTVVKAMPVESVYGVSTLYKLVDGTGNYVTWFSSSAGTDLTVGQTYTLKATVKKHEDYRGTKQTVITRAKIA
jgi:hypothetical protein